MQTQEKFIREYLDNTKICPIDIQKYNKRINDIYFQNINNTMKVSILSGPDMQAILCLLQTFLLNSETDRKYMGVSILNKNYDKWLLKMDKLPVKSVEGWIYITTVMYNNFEIVIKTPKQNIKSNILSSLQEYLLGIAVMNKLRYKIPTFLYTFGAFSCENPDKYGNINIKELCTKNSYDLTNNSVYVMTEKINGETVMNLLQQNLLSFENWLNIFMQLLLSLEVAQKDCKFTHFDLHAGNVMVITKPVSYNINIDNKTYSINQSRFTPMIIDFGMSSAKIDDILIGDGVFPEYGMFKFMVPGYDMFKFLTYSCRFAQNNQELLMNMIKLYNFFGNDDVYNIRNTGISGINTATIEFCKLGSYSKLATYTPLMFFNWIYTNYSFLLPNIQTSQRENFMFLSYTSYIDQYNYFFSQYETGINDTLTLIEKCLKNKNYILTLYNINILHNINLTLISDKINDKIEKYKKILSKYSSKFIEKDLTILDKVHTLSYDLNQNSLLTLYNEILNISIRNTSPYMKKEFYNRVSYYSRIKKELEPYLQLYYTILELKIQSLFSEWIFRFENSKLFLFYNANINFIERMERWSETLINSINIS